MTQSVDNLTGGDRMTDRTPELSRSHGRSGRHPLPTRPLGRTGHDVTVLGYGAMELRGTSHRNPRPLAPGAAERVLRAVLDAGVNLIDTSIDYGESEELIGAALSSRRDEYFLATKAGCPLAPQPDGPDLPAPTAARAAGPLPHDYRRDNIVAGLEQSLRRLRTDHVDLLQLHISPSLDAIHRDDVIATLTDLRDQGKVRFLGSSSTLPNIEDHLALGVFDVFQVPYSALERTHAEVIRRSHEAGAGILVRGGVAKGEPRLRGRNAPSGQGRGKPDVWAAWDAARLDDLLDGEDRTGFVLRYTISHPGVSTTIVGTADADHLRRNAEVVRRGPLAADVVAEVDRRLDEVAARAHAEPSLR
jgi:aryl-alcohol dehydrogenase-like predicted oxidoreductase